MTNSARAVVRKFVLTAGAAALVFGAGAARGQNGVYLRIVTQQGALDGSSKDAAHMNWIPVVSVVAADLDGDAMADREASAPSVSEIRTAREQGSGMATGRMASGPSGQASSAEMVRESPTKQSTGATAVRESPTQASTGQTALRESPTKQSAGKRMHKPFVITKEIDKTSPLLRQLAASGTPISEVDVDLGRPSGMSKTGRYTLTNVMVSSIQQVGHGGDRPMESVSFTYQKIEMK